jgi:hypothetical protein
MPVLWEESEYAEREVRYADVELRFVRWCWQSALQEMHTALRASHEAQLQMAIQESRCEECGRKEGGRMSCVIDAGELCWLDASIVFVAMMIFLLIVVWFGLKHRKKVQR